ncbi:hypothetical protein LY76DRAFT_381339 [Colletotrichum caudatum]|nr:hypothetical protein LY76DRAFT_381339 [Colletotrichum caudatum]
MSSGGLSRAGNRISSPPENRLRGFRHLLYPRHLFKCSSVSWGLRRGGILGVMGGCPGVKSVSSHGGNEVRDVSPAWRPLFPLIPLGAGNSAVKLPFRFSSSPLEASRGPVPYRTGWSLTPRYALDPLFQFSAQRAHVRRLLRMLPKLWSGICSELNREQTTLQYQQKLLLVAS